VGVVVSCDEQAAKRIVENTRMAMNRVKFVGLLMDMVISYDESAILVISRHIKCPYR
jgi:hypothetical protein